MINAEVQAAVDFVVQKYGTKPTKMLMNRHTFHELVELDGEYQCGGVIPDWASVPVEIDETKADHDIEFDMPEYVKSPSMEELTNESSLPVSVVQS